jgi:hypothetical protein
MQWDVAMRIAFSRKRYAVTGAAGTWVLYEYLPVCFSKGTGAGHWAGWLEGAGVEGIVVERGGERTNGSRW